jgi:glycosyltransferase involved in cell wall biosynthesis
VVHVHAGVAFEGCELVLAARRAGTRVVLRTEHLPYEIRTPEQAECYRGAAEAVDRLICVSQGVAESFRRAGVPPARLAVVRNGVPVMRPAHPSPVPRRLGLPDDVLVVLTPARFSEQKGHCYLLPAVQSVVRSRADVRFVWSGDGPTLSDMRAAVTAEGLSDYVLFLPPSEEIAELLAVADLLVLPSLHEGMPLVVLEAMSAGVPVLATRVCGTDEIVVDGATGRLIPARDPDALATALLDLLADPWTRRQYSQAARHDYETWGTERRMAAETADIYDELLLASPPADSVSDRAGAFGHADPARSRRERGAALATGSATRARR